MHRDVTTDPAGGVPQDTALDSSVVSSAVESSDARVISEDELLDVVDELAARRPVAARLVAMTADDSVGSPELASVLSGDVTLTARVMRLANSAYYGLGGRVRAVPFAVTVVGFTTIRAMAAAAVVGVDAEEVLPSSFWARSRATARACYELAPVFGVPRLDAFTLGLLTSLGQAVLAHAQPDAYWALLQSQDVTDGGRAALVSGEVRVFGKPHSEVSALVLSSWSFPQEIVDALYLLDSPDTVTSAWSACLATAVEASSRLDGKPELQRDVTVISGGAISEERVTAMLPLLREAEADADW
ncbi:HDOD domain-containing protein [Quadrisphaera granulorum]|uniref:HDOD domain-containing protein n=1 Tax=Quadrisphaera granulorum TaxID=317664 RepID=A0A315ZNC6_9ACTN|nr:HDOD domain-containing protein [Quadrisphaera granulorum]PWJ47125.1 HDOD domain-containing protein [Quadrisphaera granulorum]SZE98929.1 HDOD domain-containing protein [Quadrisphaera granulorum]